MSRSALAPALCLLAALALPSPAQAHQTSTNAAFVQVTPEGLRLQVDLDGQLAQEASLASPATDEARRQLLDRLLVVSADARPCPWIHPTFYASPSGRWVLAAESVCRGTTLHIDSPLFAEDTAPSRAGHALQVRIQQRFATERCLFGQLRTPCEIRLAPAAPPTPAASSPPAAPAPSHPAASFVHFAYRGLLHILQGLDHLLFLALTMTAALRFKQAAAQISAFTVGHSITLGLVALSLLSPPSALVETGIALSIALLAAERLRGQSRLAGPWATGLFGLLHGLGFGAGLKEQGFERAEKLVALAGFNAGVELGQLALAVPFVALCMWLQRSGRSRRLQLAVGVPGLALGVIWAAQRM